jgi:hypothetical protein
MAILFALFFQYSLAPSILHKNKWWNLYKSIPGMGKLLYSSWTDTCSQYGDLDGPKADLYIRCVQNSGVYRPMAVSSLFFAVSAVVAYMNPSLNREIWPAKYAAYLFALCIAMFIPNSYFMGFSLALMRLCAMVFIVVQQVILIDMAYNWNERWVDKSDQCEAREWGSGKGWLRAIVICATLLYGASMVGMGYLYHYFSGCASNQVVLAFGWIGILVMSVVQLSGEEGSVLTTAVISAYSAYVAYATVSKNPNAVCNPTLGSDDVWGIAVGMMLTLLSLSWTGWSYTAQERLTEGGIETVGSLRTNSVLDARGVDAARLNLDTPFLDPEERPTRGVVVQSEAGQQDARDAFNERAGPLIWKLNVVLVLISCWVSASLTGWGAISGGIGEGGEHTAANPLVGKWNMVMMAVAQNLAVCLYLWTLLAPRLFPDRDFS